MPGKVLQVLVKPEQSVAAGDRLLVLEAMKMEQRLTAPLAGTIKAIHVREGDQVSDGAVLVEIAPVQP
jgi:3-methylcrotonyl-CoA carboxylase alpha subunit